MINNRQAGRRRGRGGQQRTPNNPGRPEQGNRIDNRARGNAAQLLEKYKMLARDAQMQGDRVNTEYYLQFADHYFRVLSETRARFEEQNQGQSQNQGQNQNQGQYQNQQRRGRDDADMAEDDGDEREMDDGGHRPAHEPRRQQAEERVARDDQPRSVAPARDETPVRDREPAAEAPLNGHRSEDDAVAAPRRGRPRRVRPAETEAAETFDAAILPPALSVTPEPAANEDDAAEPAPAPRRRGRPRKTETDAATV